MLTAAGRKSLTDLTRRRARAAFTVLTLALAVASVGILAVSGLMTKLMDTEVARNRLADVTVTMAPLPISDAKLAELGRLPNVTAADPHSVISTRVVIGQRRAKALVYGVRDFTHQSVDVVQLVSGQAPANGVLTDVQNAKRDKLSAGTGDIVRVFGADGRARPLRVSGVGRTFEGGTEVSYHGTIVLYAPQRTVAELSGSPGYTSIGFRLRDTSRAAADATVSRIRAAMRSAPGFTGFADLPTIRENGAYPGKDQFGKLASLFNVVTLLALLSALVLMSNTMTTLVGEQTKEIAAMKAIGGRRRQIRRMYRRTALLLGSLGTVIGLALGILLANAITNYFGSALYGIDGGFAVVPGVLAASIVVGVLGPPLAALPALRRAGRVPVAEALQATGSAVGGEGRLDALLRRLTFLPRSAQIGLRGVGRRKRRTLATAVQVALAVGTLLAFLGVGVGLGRVTRAEWDNHTWDTMVAAVSNRPFDARADRLIRTTPGVRRAQPVIANMAKTKNQDVVIYGLPPKPMFRPNVVEGRWYTDGERTGGASVVVIARALADITHTHPGDSLNLRTAAGPASFRVIGIADTQWNNGRVLLTSLPAMRRVLNVAAPNLYWIQTSSRDHGFIDRVTTRLEDRLGAAGNQPETQIHYVAVRDNVNQNKGITSAITVLGLVIVGISMVGLVNAMTTAVLERTREIGMLRCVGARAKDVRRIFATEGIVTAVIGWAAGVPLGYLLGKAIVWAIEDTMGIRVALAFPVIHIVLALVGTILLGRLVLAMPIRRAVRFKPGEALRYA